MALMGQPAPNGGGETFDSNWDPLEKRWGYSFLERLKPVSSSKVEHSIAGIGFETLDRETFDPEPLYDPLAETGCKYVRLQTGWIRSEKKKGEYSFAWLDEIVDNLRKRGMIPWFSASFGNPLYTPVPEWDKIHRDAAENGVKVANGMIRGYIGESPYYHGEEGMRGWLEYLKALALHFRGRVGHIEIWNEADVVFGRFWLKNGKTPYPEMESSAAYERCARDYADFCRKSARAIRSVCPEIKTMINLSRATGLHPKVLASEKVYEDLDIFTFHNYTNVPEQQSLEKVELLRALFLNRPNGRMTEIWQGESGRATLRQHAGFYAPTPYNQAKFIVRRMMDDQISGVTVSSIFTASELNQYYEDGSTQEFGLFKSNPCRPKLAAFAFQGMCKMLAGLENAPGDLITVNTPDSCMPASFLSYRVIARVFRRRGYPVVAAWLPEHPQVCVPAVQAEFILNTDLSFQFRDPVVVDPIRQNVYRLSMDLISRPEWAFGGIVIAPLYFTDYPLFLTERDALND